MRRATNEDRGLLATIAAEGFYADPVLSWVFPDASTRLERLTLVFHGLTSDMLATGGQVYVVDDACAAFWRDPSFEHGRTAANRVEADAGEIDVPFTDDEMTRLTALGETMMAAHPHEPHWYLNVLSTIPSRQGEGLGASALDSVLRTCDAEGVPAYLESTNPRNMTLYRRHGFVETRTLDIPDGPPLYAMWREPGR